MPVRDSSLLTLSHSGGGEIEIRFPPQVWDRIAYGGTSLTKSCNWRTYIVVYTAIANGQRFRRQGQRVTYVKSL